MANTGSDTPGDDVNSDRDLLLGRVSRPGASRKPAAPSRKGSVPSSLASLASLADSALLRENLQRFDGLLERTTALEEALRETSAVLARIAPAIDEFIRQSGDLSRELSKTTDELSKVLPRLDGIDGKMTDTAEAVEPFRQDVKRLEERNGELARALESFEPGGAADNNDTNDLPVSTQRRISQQDGEMPPSVPALAVPDLADPDAMERAVGVLGDLHKRIGIGLFVLEQALPEADRKRAIADFRRKQDAGPRRRWLRRFLAVVALVIVTAWIEATWYPFGRILAWARYLTGWPL